MDINMDLHIRLLKDRFPENSSVETCEGLKNVFFCARNVGSHLYEGRLYVSEKSLFFVSSFSSGMTYDKIVELSNIEKAVFPRKVIPTMELTLDHGLKECFTNFRDLKQIVEAMKLLLTEDKVTIETHRQGVYPNFNRMVSIPAKPPVVSERSFHRSKREHQQHNFQIVRPCPYYSQSGFCPRKKFCQLPHTPHMVVFPSNSFTTSHTSPDKSMSTPPFASGQEFVRSLSLPVYTSDDGTVSTQEEPDDINGADGERTPSPVSKLNVKPGTESSVPPTFDFANQDFSNGSIPIPPPLPPVLSDLPGYEAFLNAYYNGNNSDENEESVPVEMPAVLNVYPASHINRADINSGDKVILSEEVLAACECRRISYPMTFQFKNNRGATVYAGVLEFTSPLPTNAYLPQWMFDHLNLNEGEEVDFQHVDLPKGKFVQLQPVSSAWLGVPHDKRTSILEFQLKNFQTLTEGTKVTIVYDLNRYTFKVLQCKPGKGISIVNSDLNTDVIEPADFNRFHSIEEWQAENIPLSEPVECSIATKSYRHFVLLPQHGKELPAKLRVEVKHTSGDPDLFLCQTCSTPSQSRYTWCNQDIGNSTIHLSTIIDNYDTLKPVYAGVISLTSDSQFTICFHGDTNDSVASNTGHVLRSAPNDSAISTGSGEGTVEETDASTTTVPPDHQKCSYCGIVMPQWKLLMHERHCAQSMFTCQTCKERFPNSMEKKHDIIAHQLLKCECNEELPQLALHQHQLSQCVKRSVKCQFPWCQLSFPLDQLQSHESACGRKPVDCPVCSVEVNQIELKIHLEVYHQVEVEHVDWSKPINSQLLPSKPKEPRFKCHCGEGFEYEDDLQVHQLTECTMVGVDNDDSQLVG